MDKYWKSVQKKKYQLMIGTTTFGLIFATYKLLKGSKGQKQNQNFQISFDNLTLSSFNRSEDGLIGLSHPPPGIMNKGNVCFVNSVLQALASLPKFIQFIEKLVNSIKTFNISGEITYQLYNILMGIYIGLNYFENLDKQCILNPQELIWTLMQETEYSYFQEQQDSHEFFKFVMKHIDEVTLTKQPNDLQSLISKQKLVIHKLPMLWFTKTHLGCMTCSYQSEIKVESQYDISIDIASHQIQTINDALNLYFKDDIIEDYICPKCSLESYIFYHNKFTKSEEFLGELEKLRKKTFFDFDQLKEKLSELNKKYNMKKIITPQRRRVIKRTQIVDYPEIFIIHIKRLVNDNFGNLYKLNKLVKFGSKTRLNEKNKYILSSVISHYGSEMFGIQIIINDILLKGHYVTYRRSWVKRGGDQLERSLWYVTSDQFIKYVDPQVVFQSEAYILCYEKIE